MYGYFLLTSALFERRMSVLMGLVLASTMILCTSGFIPTFARTQEWGVGWMGKLIFHHWIAQTFCKGVGRGLCWTHRIPLVIGTLLSLIPASLVFSASDRPTHPPNQP